MTNTNTKMATTALFLEERPLAAHVAALRSHRGAYITQALWNTTKGLAMTAGTKIRVLAAAWGTGERELAAALLELEPGNGAGFGVPVVLGAVQLLDARRKAKQFAARLARLEQGEQKVKPAKLGAAKTKLSDVALLEKELADVEGEPLSGVSGALQRHITRWVKGLPKEKLEFWLLALPKEPWVELAQLCHFSPKAFAVPYFLSHSFGDAAPEGTLAAEAAGITVANLAEKAAEFSVPYSYVRRRFQGQMPDSAKVAMAKYMPLDQLVWYYDDAQDCLATEDGAVETILDERLAAGEAPTGLTAGKLLERLLAFLKVGEVTDADTLGELFPGVGAPILAAALRRFGGDVERTAMELFELSSAQIEQRFSPAPGTPAVLEAEEAAPSFVARLMPHAARAMSQLACAMPKPVFIMGDASASMQVAVSTSTILASLIAAVADAGLCFFNTACIAPPVIPRTVEEVLAVAKAVKADGATCPAAALAPLLEAKQVVRQLVVVSDEEENTKHKGRSFAELFAQYEKEVSPGCRVTFVSFLADPNAPGQMVAELEAAGYAPEHFTLHRDRPDLTKTDALLALMSANTVEVAAERKAMEAQLEAEGLAALIKTLRSAEERAQPLPSPEPAPAPEPEPEPREQAVAFLQGCGIGAEVGVVEEADADAVVVQAVAVESQMVDREPEGAPPAAPA